MPKGIYPRGNRSSVAEPKSNVEAIPSQNFANLKEGGMRTQVTDAPVTPETANSNVVKPISQSGDDDEMSTTERLFGDVLRDQNIQNNLESEPVRQGPEETSPTTEPTKEISKEEPQVPPTPAVEGQDDVNETFDIEKVLNKKVKAKIDGKEEEVTLKELRDSYQINKHLAQAADKVGEERRKLAEERRQIQELRQQRQDQYRAPTQEPGTWKTDPMPTAQSQGQDPVLQRIQFLEAQFQQLAQGTQPVIYQSNRQRVSDELRSQGFNDFLEYIPKMEAHLTGVQDPQLVNFYDTPQGSKALYFQLKAQDMIQSRTTAPQVPAPAQNIAPPATRIDSGSQPNGSMNDDGTTNYRRAFKRAIETDQDSAVGREAWNQVLLQKGIIPSE